MSKNLFLKRYCTYPIWNKQYKLYKNPLFIGGNGVIYNTKIEKRLCKKVKINSNSKNEIHRLFQLQSTNIVPKLYDIYQSKTNFYLIMEKYDQDLFGLLTNPYLKLSIEMKIFLILEILRKVNTIHNHQIAHCDLKPENIVINYDKIPQVNNKNDLYTNKNSKLAIIDFDHSHNLYSKPQKIYGTDSYRCPRFKDTCYQLSKGDIYSLGKTFIFLLTNGQYDMSYFTTSNINSTLQKTINKYEPTIYQHKIDYLIYIINQMILEEPKQRKSINELIDMFQIFLNNYKY